MVINCLSRLITSGKCIKIHLSKLEVIMCGRYCLYSDRKILKELKISVDRNYNISPGKHVYVLDEKLEPKQIVWGINMEWNKKKFMLINARIETIHIKKIYRNTKRCIFIADGYYEWLFNGKSKIPFYHYLKNRLLFFGGIYNEKGGCIVTMQSCLNLSVIHNRQPFFLEKKHFNHWINFDEANIDYDNIINYHEVSKKINRVWENDKSLIKGHKNE